MNDMNEAHIPRGLQAYRGQLHQAVARDLSRSHGPLTVLARLRPRRRRGFIAYAVGAAAAVALAVALVTAGGPVQPADAAILHHVAAVLTPPAGTVLHEMGTIGLPGQDARAFELWAQADAPYGVVAKSGPVGGPTPGQHQAETNSSATGPAVQGSGSHAPLDAAVAVRALVQSGDATVVGTTAIDGVAAYELQVTAAPNANLDGTVYVAQSDYRPLLIKTTSGETISYSTYEYLPSSAWPAPGD
ncbi:MAG TPA: hypothetical protein VK576_04560 [Thermoleophilia bacterium]|nr:hypothetical protein [Thermoleophilia bacterium]